MGSSKNKNKKKAKQGNKLKSKSSKSKSSSTSGPLSAHKTLSTAFGGSKMSDVSMASGFGVRKSMIGSKTSKTQQKKSKKELKKEQQKQRSQTMNNNILKPYNLMAVDHVKSIGNGSVGSNNDGNNSDDFCRHFYAKEKTKESVKNSVALSGGSFCQAVENQNLNNNSSSSSLSSSIASSLGLASNAATSLQNVLGHEREIVDILFDNDSGMILSVGRDEMINMWQIQALTSDERQLAKTQLLQNAAKNDAGKAKQQQKTQGTSANIFGQSTLVGNPNLGLFSSLRPGSSSSPGNPMTVDQNTNQMENSTSFTPSQLQRFTPAFKLAKQKMNLTFPAALWSASLDCNCLFTGMGDGSVRVQQTTTSEHFTFVAHDKRVTCVRRHPETGFIMTSGAEGCFKIWNLMRDEVSGLSNQKQFELALHSEIRTFHVVNNAFIYFATARGLYRVSMNNIENAKPEKIGGSAVDASNSNSNNSNSSTSSTNNLSSNSVGVMDIIPYLANGEWYVIGALRDGSIRVYHAMTGDMKHSIMPSPDYKMVQRFSLLNPESTSGSSRLLCAHQDGKVSSFELPTFTKRACWQAFDSRSSNTSTVVAVPQTICSRLGCDISGLFLTTSSVGGLQLWQHVPEGGIQDDDL